MVEINIESDNTKRNGVFFQNHDGSDCFISLYGLLKESIKVNYNGTIISTVFDKDDLLGKTVTDELNVNLTWDTLMVYDLIINYKKEYIYIYIHEKEKVKMKSGFNGEENIKY